MRAKSLCLAALLCLAACEKNEPKPEATETKAKKADDDDAKAKVEATDPDLAEAVAAASVGAPPGAAPGQVPGGPPADGVFAPGAADKELAKGAPPKITLGSEGDAPLHQLGPSKAGGKLSGTIQVAMQADPRQQAIPVLLNVSIEAKKAEAAKDDKPAPPQPVIVKVTGAKIDAPGVPKDIDEQLGKLKGSKVEYALLPGGAGVGYKFEASKNASEEFKDVIRSLSDAVALLTIPYPDKPLGKGGFFMVTSRDDFLGLDMVTYRMIRVKDMTDQGATLDVSTKRYAASRTFDFPGLPPEVDRNLADFQANSEGTVQTGFGAILPAQGQVTSQLQAQFAAKDPKQRLAIQISTRAQLDLK